ncbi:hypothetical protein AB9D59_26885 [Blautia producta]|uniref:hypothetical protein n=1 Tax=Blautia producta TaxID=33035 RepID=UPI0035BE4F67
MKKTIQVTITDPQYIVDTNVTFAQVSDWFGHTTKDLKLDIIFPEQGKKKKSVYHLDMRRSLAADEQKRPSCLSGRFGKTGICGCQCTVQDK